MNLRDTTLAPTKPGAKMSADPVQASPMMKIRDLPARAVGEVPEPGTADSSRPQVARTCSLSQGERLEGFRGGEEVGVVVTACEEHSCVSSLLRITFWRSRFQVRNDGGDIPLERRRRWRWPVRSTVALADYFKAHSEGQNPRWRWHTLGEKEGASGRKAAVRKVLVDPAGPRGDQTLVIIFDHELGGCGGEEGEEVVARGVLYLYL